MADNLSATLKSLEGLLVDPPVKLGDVQAYVNAVLHTDSLDDRFLLLEKLLVLMARLSEEESDALNKASRKIQEFVIDLLYKDLPHPPHNFLSETNLVAFQTTAPNLDVAKPKYAARSADGANYTPLAPSMGRARTPYARSVPALSTLPRTSLPRPDLVFDTLLKRDKFKEHPGGISSLFFAFADLIIHTIFNTNTRDWTINDASSYLDLSILYGSSKHEVDLIRRNDGSGRLWDDVFADRRLLMMPPASCALLVLLCRNHNFIADRILHINENGEYIPAVESLDGSQKQKQDDEIFDKARLVNCGYFMHIILGDYVGAILGLVRDGHSWRLDPLMEIRRSDHTFSPRGEGNVCSIEFNLLYRWHATLSQDDEKWTEDAFKRLLGDQDPTQVTSEEFHIAVRKAIVPPADYREWTFGGLKRVSEKGPFSDSDLATMLQTATKNRAAAFGARGIPEVLRIVEIMGIEQGRRWGTCSLNEFRKFIGLQPYSSFAEWNPDPEIHNAAAALYHDINNLELHVGMQAEESKEPGPGAGLCPGYTISRSILADAVCLTRGDRYLTVDFTPQNFTTWGYNDCQYDINDGSYGGLLTKLLFRTLPNHYTPRSAYAHFPFLDPEYLRTTDNAIPIAKYDFNPPSRSWKHTITVGSYGDLTAITTSQDFVAPYELHLRTIMPGIGTHVPQTDMVKKLLLENKSRWANYFKSTTHDLITKAKLLRPGANVHYLDIIKDVINVLPIKWICEELAGLPITTSPSDTHAFTADQYYDMFAEICQYVYANSEVESDWHLREGSIQTFERFLKVVTGHLSTFSSWLSTDGTPFSQNNHSRAFLKSLNEMAGSQGKTAAAVGLFSEVVPTAVHFSQALSHVVFDCLDSGETFTRTIDAKNLITRALSKDPIVSGFYRTALRATTLPSSTRVDTGDRVWASVIDANADSARPQSASLFYGVGEHGLLSPAFFETIAPGILQEILTLPGLQKTGTFNRFYEYRNGMKVQMYVNLKGNVVPFPDSLKVQYTHK